jgi:hypothetical protein
MLSLHRLPDQLPGEKIIKVIRRDLFILFKKVALFFFLLVLPALFLYLLAASRPDIAMADGSASLAVIVLGASAYYLFVWLFFFFSFIDYYLDIWVITSERIIDIEQQGFFSRVISEQKLSRIQDVTSQVRGVIPTIMKYGEVLIQTAGAEERFHFYQVPNPDIIRDTVIKLSEECRARHQGDKQP